MIFWYDLGSLRNPGSGSWTVSFFVGAALPFIEILAWLLRVVFLFLSSLETTFLEIYKLVRRMRGKGE